MSTSPRHIIISVREAPDAHRISPDELLYLSGNIDILAHNTLLEIGSFEGALLLLPTIDTLADATRKMRRGDKTIEVALVGDVGSMWLLERKRGRHVGLSIAHGGIETEPVTREELDRALAESIDAFLETLSTSQPVRSWPQEPMRILNNVASTWPSVARLRWTSR